MTTLPYSMPTTILDSSSTYSGLQWVHRHSAPGFGESCDFWTLNASGSTLGWTWICSTFLPSDSKLPRPAFETLSLYEFAFICRKFWVLALTLAVSEMLSSIITDVKETRTFSMPKLKVLASLPDLNRFLSSSCRIWWTGRKRLTHFPER